MINNMHGLGLADYCVFVATLLISLAIGVYFRFTGGKQRTAKEFLFGDKKQSILPVAVSLMASFISSISLIGIPAEFYSHGTQFIIIDFGYLLLTPVAAYYFMPVFFKLETTSVYEYLFRRFGAVTRTVTSLVFSLQMIMYMGVVLYAPSIALQALTQLSENWSILVVGVVCTLYSTLGGMKAVIATDVFQALLMYAAVFLIVATASYDLGGIDKIWQIADERGRIEFFDFSLDPTKRHTFWSLVVAGGLQFLSLYAVNQTQVQRYLSMKDLKTAIKALYISMPIFYIQAVTTAFAGLAIFSKYKDCDPIASGRIPSSDQLLPLYIIDTVGNIPGVTGIFVAGIFSAALSTVSALLNSLAAVTLEDYIKPIYRMFTNKEIIGEKKITFISKSLALLYGIICIGVAFCAKYLGSILQATLTIFGAVGGPLLGIFTLGMFFPFANEQGALIGIVSGLLVSLWLGFGGPKPPISKLPVSTAGCPSNSTNELLHLVLPLVKSVNDKFTKYERLSDRGKEVFEAVSESKDYFYLFRISYLWYIAIGFLITVIVGTLTSICFMRIGNNRKRIFELDPNLFSPPVANYLKKRNRCYNINNDYNKVTDSSLVSSHL